MPCSQLAAPKLTVRQPVPWVLQTPAPRFCHGGAVPRAVSFEAVGMCESLGDVAQNHTHPVVLGLAAARRAD